MRRYIGIAAGVVLLAAALSATGALPAAAQGAVKPLIALIVNDVTNPVPVRVTNAPPTLPALVKCTLDAGGSSSADEITAGTGGGSGVGSIECPGDVTVVDVQRVFFVPGLSAVSGTSNVLHWQVTVGLSSNTSLEAGEVIAVLTAGAPDTVLSRPVRLDRGVIGNVIMFNKTASTGIPGTAAVFTGTVIFEGVPVP
jgi:hypothetical protein